MRWFVRRVETRYDWQRGWRWRVWTKVALALVVAALAAMGGVVGARWGAVSWTKHACFTVNYVDLRGGYAPIPALYTSIGTVYGGIDNGEERQDEIGKLLSGDRWCGPLHYSNGAVYAPWIYFSEGRVVSHKDIAPQPPQVNS